MENIPFISEVPIIEIRGTIAIERARSGDCPIERAMDVDTLTRFVERAQRALQRHAAGDVNVWVD